MARKTFVLDEKVIDKLNAIREWRSMKTEVDAIVYTIVEFYEIMKKKYGTNNDN